MDEQDDALPNQYPIGRGYGHDYMRGGEVFDGYGYSRRSAYGRQRGSDEPRTVELAPPSVADVAAEAQETGPPPAEDVRRASAQEAPSTSGTNSPPVPQLEGTFGSAGTNRYSRSFYVTQAQLQQRVYGARRSTEMQRVRLRALQRLDEEIRSDVEETLSYDSWVAPQRLNVDVIGGVVTLRGVLASEEEVQCACEDAWEVPGVREVRSELRVLPVS